MRDYSILLEGLPKDMSLLTQITMLRSYMLPQVRPWYPRDGLDEAAFQGSRLDVELIRDEVWVNYDD